MHYHLSADNFNVSLNGIKYFQLKRNFCMFVKIFNKFSLSVFLIVFSDELSKSDFSEIRIIAKVSSAQYQLFSCK